MPKHQQTPTAVRVARWTTIAAAVTALGSFFNTMWTERPWWKEPPPSPIVAPVSPPKNDYNVGVSGLGFSMKDETAPTTAAAPRLSLWEKFLNQLQRSPTATWIMIAAGAIGISSLVYELLWKRRDRILRETRPPF
jgi:hypothetical protein